MKKILILMLVLALSLSVFAACGDDTKGQGDAPDTNADAGNADGDFRMESNSSYDEFGNLIKDTLIGYRADGTVARKEVREYEYKEMTESTYNKETEEYETANVFKCVKATYMHLTAEDAVTYKDVTEYTYDENGKLKKTVCIVYDANGNETGRSEIMEEE